ncbi:hypothetical protein ATKI12_6583 [Kitasatospora sp. Ki12]
MAGGCPDTTDAIYLAFRDIAAIVTAVSGWWRSLYVVEGLYQPSLWP